jgi:hypothetical protein
MAKQQGSGVVAAALKVSESQGQFQDRVGQFMTGYDKAMETKNKMEAKNQELQAKTNAYVDQFDGDVDLAGFSDEDKAVVKDQVIINRNEFIEGANGAAKIKDKTSPEYQMYMDKMNNAMSNMEKLRGNLEGIANLKVEYANGFEQGIYSNSQKNSENLLRANAILEGSISSIGDDGSLNFKGYTVPNMTGAGDDFTVEDFSYNTKSFKKPFTVANNEAQAILGMAEAQETLKGEATENQVKIIKSQLNSALSNPDVLYSILSNSELQLIPLDSIDPNDPNAKQLAIDLLAQGVLDARGAGLTEEPETPGSPSNAPKYSGQGAYMIGHYNQKRGIIPYPGTNNIAYFMVDASNNRILGSGTGGVYTKEDKKKAVGYQRFTKQDGQGWLTDATYPVVPLNNPKEFYLQNNNLIKYG